MAQKTIKFYFDPISPYAWLGWKNYQLIKKINDIDTEVIPVLFAGLLNFHKNIGPAEIPAKKVAIFSDVIRKSELSGHKFKGPPTHPFNPLKPLRICLAISNMEKRILYTDLLLTGIWENGEGPTSEDFLKKIIKKCGENPEEILKLSQDQKIKNKFKEDNEYYAKNSIFGVPTFQIDSHIFWGADQIPIIEKYLNGQLDLKEEVVKEFLSRPSSASRT